MKTDFLQAGTKMIAALEAYRQKRAEIAGLDMYSDSWKAELLENAGQDVRQAIADQRTRIEQAADWEYRLADKAQGNATPEQKRYAASEAFEELQLLDKADVLPYLNEQIAAGADLTKLRELRRLATVKLRGDVQALEALGKTYLSDEEQQAAVRSHKAGRYLDHLPTLDGLLQTTLSEIEAGEGDVSILHDALQGILHNVNKDEAKAATEAALSADG